ncbi:MAG: O-acetyl-ADP-ribose deacetylase [Candidatus Hadarchaeales archaeon]
MELRVGKAVLRLVQGDITEQETEAIVNAANPSLMGGGGVDGAIHRKGGPTIREECARIREREWPDGLPVGEAVITSGGRLKARYVIHTVGPIWRGGNKREPQMLARAYRSCLQLAVSRGIRRLSFPSISTGAYGYPVEKASRVALRTVKEFLEKEDRLEEVRFVLFTEGDLKVYEEAARELFPG